MGKLTDSILLKTNKPLDTYLYDAISSGMTASQIAKEHGVTREAVCKHLRRLKARPEIKWKMRKPRVAS